MNSKSKLHSKEFRMCKSEHIYLFGCFLVYLLWAVLFTQDTYGPDEVARELVPRFIYLNGCLPTGFEESVRIPGWGSSYAFTLSLPYITGALFMKLMSFFSDEFIMLRIACRLSSVLSGVGIGYFSIKITKRISDSPLRWVFIVMMTLLPQIIFLNSYFNLDSFALFTVMIILYAWITGIQTDWNYRSCITLAVGMGLCFLAYQFAWSFILCSFLIYVTWHAVNNPKIRFKDFILKGLFILCITFVVCGWSFVRNYLIYDGDWLSLNQAGAYQELYAIDSLKPSLRETFKSRGESVLYMLQSTPWLIITARSFIFGFGYLNIFPEWAYFYKLYDVLGESAAIGLFLSPLLDRQESSAVARKTGFWVVPFLFLASAITFGISVYYSWSTDYQAQGRYIIYCLPLVAAFISLGLDRLATTATEVLALLRVRLKKSTLPRLVAAGACIWIVISAYIGYDTLVKQFLYVLAGA